MINAMNRHQCCQASQKHAHPVLNEEYAASRYKHVPAPAATSLISNQQLRMALLDRDQVQAIRVRNWIEDQDCQCTLYRDVEEFQRGFYHMSYDLVILDYSERVSACEQNMLHWIRKALGNTVPIVVISSSDDEHDTVRALYEGADDYLVKPLRHNEFLARLHALVRRTYKEPDILSSHPDALDVSSKQRNHGSQGIKLTRKEYELTAYLYRNRGRVVSRKELLASVWGNVQAPSPRTIDAHISRLRSKLPLLVSGRWNLASIYLRGYRLDEQVGTVPSGSLERESSKEASRALETPLR